MTPPSPLTLDDYEAIEQAVLETERGRWFLAEFARRNRAADTGEILDALGRLESRLPDSRALPAPPPEPEPKIERIAPTLAKLADAASRLRSALDAPAEAEERVELAVSRIATLERAIAAVRDVAAGIAPANAPATEGPSRHEASVLPPPMEPDAADVEAEEEAEPETPVRPEPAVPAPAFRLAMTPSPEAPRAEPAVDPATPQAPAGQGSDAKREARREAKIRAAQARMQARSTLSAQADQPRAAASAIPPAWSRATEERMSPPAPPLAPALLPRALLESLSDVEKALLFA